MKLCCSQQKKRFLIEVFCSPQSVMGTITKKKKTHTGGKFIFFNFLRTWANCLVQLFLFFFGILVEKFEKSQAVNFLVSENKIYGQLSFLCRKIFFFRLVVERRNAAKKSHLSP